MKKVYNICKSLIAVVGSAAMMCACDSTANDIKVEAINGQYKGTVVVGLYVPEYLVEVENMMDYNTETVGLCADTVKTTIDMHFYNNDKVQISVDKLNDVKFAIPFLDKDGNVRELFSQGYLAKLYNMVRGLQATGVITPEEFNAFYEKIDTLRDNLNISGVHTNQMPMVEQGSMLATYDYEQYSYYTQFNLEELTYERTAEVLEPFEYMKQLLIQKGIESEEMYRLDALIHNAVPTTGTVTDGWGWCTVAYSNYQAAIDLHLERATGMLDVLSIALFGAVQDENGQTKYDDRGRPMANKPMWFVVWYNGQIEDTGIYKPLVEN